MDGKFFRNITLLISSFYIFRSFLEEYAQDSSKISKKKQQLRVLTRILLQLLIFLFWGRRRERMFRRSLKDP